VVQYIAVCFSTLIQDLGLHARDASVVVGCSVVQSVAVWYGTLQYVVVWYSTL